MELPMKIRAFFLLCLPASALAAEPSRDDALNLCVTLPAPAERLY